MKDKESCEKACKEEGKLQAYRLQIEERDVEKVAGFFKALSDPTRLKIAYALTLDELCVFDITIVTGVSMATASHHARLLRDLGYASYRKEGKLAFYQIKDKTVKKLINMTLNERVVTIHE